MADCCQGLKTEITALRNDVAALNNKFSSKSETAYLKQQIKNLQQQLNQLKAEIKSIPRVNEQKIIEQSIAGAEQLILPSIGVAIARALLPIDNKIAQLNGKLLSFGKTATQALSQAGNASKIANTANNVGNKALGIAKGATSTASNALAKYGALATAVFSVVASLATLHILGGRIDVLEKGQFLLGNEVSRNISRILGIQATAKEAKELSKIASTEALEAGIEAEKAFEVSLQARKIAVTATTATGSLTTASTKSSAQTAAAAATAAQALVIANQALAIAKTTKPGSMDLETKNKLNQIEKAIGNLNVTLPTALIASAGFTAAVTSAAATAVCKSTKSGGCLGSSLGNISKKIDKSLINTAGIGTVSAQVASVQTQAGIISGQVATNGALIHKVSAQVAGVAGLVKAGTTAVLSKFGALNALIIAKFAATWSFLTADRTLNVFTAAASLHNAYMLSGSLSQTLFSIVDNIGNLLFKDAGGQSFSTSQVLGKTFDDWAKGLVGVTTWEGIKVQWKQFNRIYQAGANIVNSVRSMFDSVRNLSEFIAENTGRIGNALKAVQVIRADAFKWMPEQVDGRSLWTKRLENFQEAASGIEMITSEVLTITENVNQIKQQTEEFKKSIEESQPKSQVENTAIKTNAAASKTVSTSPNVAVITSDEDKEPDE